jgi:hypothetical protein
MVGSIKNVLNEHHPLEELFNHQTLRWLFLIFINLFCICFRVYFTDQNKTISYFMKAFSNHVPQGCVDNKEYFFALPHPQHQCISFSLIEIKMRPLLMKHPLCHLSILSCVACFICSFLIFYSHFDAHMANIRSLCYYRTFL